MRYKKGNTYSAYTITKGQYHSIYDGLIALVDNKLECLDDWLNDTIDEYKLEYPNANDDELYNLALDDININAYILGDDVKSVYLFKGMAPNDSFDVYTIYKCLGKV